MRSREKNEQAIFVIGIFFQLGIGCVPMWSIWKLLRRIERDLLGSGEEACRRWSKTREKLYVCGLDPKPCGRLQTMQKLNKTFPIELKENQANKTFSLTRNVPAFKDLKRNYPFIFDCKKVHMPVNLAVEMFDSLIVLLCNRFRPIDIP